MKKMMILSVLFLITGIGFGQIPQKGDIIRTCTITYNLKSEVKEEQLIEFFVNNYIPESERYWEGIKCYITKTIGDDNKNSLSLITIIPSSSRYFINDEVGNITENGVAYLEILNRLLKQLNELATYSNQSCTELIVQ